MCAAVERHAEANRESGAGQRVVPPGPHRPHRRGGKPDGNVVEFKRAVGVRAVVAVVGFVEEPAVPGVSGTSIPANPAAARRSIGGRLEAVGWNLRHAFGSTFPPRAPMEPPDAVPPLSPSDYAAFARQPDVALLAQSEVDTLRAGTSGGQRANKVETGIRMRHLPTGIVVVARRERSQLQNRDLALADLRRRLERLAHVDAPRKKTKPTAGSRRRREDAKRQQAEKKAHRRWKPE